MKRAPNLFLRKQLALFKERKVRSRLAPPHTRLALLALANFFNWREALVVVQPQTFVRWHHSAFRALWRFKSRKRGRPPLPQSIRTLIRRMHLENPPWGQQRIADELALKLGIHLSPATVRKYLANQPGGSARPDQRWSTFVRNHARAIVACDFLVTATASLRLAYVFVAMEVGSRRILYTATTHHRPQNGPRNSSANSSRQATPTSFCSTTAIVSSPPPSTTPSGISVFNPSARPPTPRPPMPIANASSAPSAASASTT